MLTDKLNLLSNLGMASFARLIWRFLRELAGEFIDKGCQKSAAALTYMTLFALVPLMTVTYSMFSVIPAFDGVADQLQDLVFKHFVPESGTEVQNYLSDFSSQARSLTAVGVVMLVVTAYLMLTNIEKTFNTIWGVKHSRKGLFSFLLYWAVLSIGPLLLGAGLIMSTYLLSLTLFVDSLQELGVATAFFRLLPVAMAAGAFTLLFAAVPNCRVPFKHAFFGGVVTAVLFELMKMVFGYFVANSSIQLIYGAFAVVPLFLLWVNLSWMIILLGAVFVRTIAEGLYSLRLERLSDISALLRCMAVFAEHSRSGDQVSDEHCLQAGVGLAQWQSLRAQLVNERWIAVTDAGDYVLSKDLSAISLWDALALVKTPLEHVGRLSKAEPCEPWEEHFDKLRQGIDQSMRRSLEVNLRQLFRAPTDI